MSQELATRYPLVLVPGMLGFVRLLLYPYWYGIIPVSYTHLTLPTIYSV